MTKQQKDVKNDRASENEGMIRKVSVKVHSDRTQRARRGLYVLFISSERQ